MVDRNNVSDIPLIQVVGTGFSDRGEDNRKDL
jgi:hypothetical protein